MLQGYLERQSACAGGSARRAGAVRRLRHPDLHPDGHGALDESCSWAAVAFGVDSMYEIAGYRLFGATRWGFADATDPGALQSPADVDGHALTAPVSIFFHCDDFEDPGWPRAAKLVIPREG